MIINNYFSNFKLPEYNDVTMQDVDAEFKELQNTFPEMEPLIQKMKLRTFDIFLKDSLNAFLTSENISNITFSEWYGTTQNYVSQLRNGYRRIDLARFSQALLKNGYMFVIDLEHKNIKYK